MILVDTSIWIDHLHRSDPTLGLLLARARAPLHPFVFGEIACGTLARRDLVLALLRSLPAAPLATHEEVLALIERRRLHGSGIGYVDAHLLAASIIHGLPLWSRGRALASAATAAGAAFDPVTNGPA